jgi:hypothetical protein
VALLRISFTLSDSVCTGVSFLQPSMSNKTERRDIIKVTSTIFFMAVVLSDLRFNYCLMNLTTPTEFVVATFTKYIPAG